MKVIKNKYNRRSKDHEEFIWCNIYGYYKIYFEAINKGSLKLDIHNIMVDYLQ